MERMRCRVLREFVAGGLLLLSAAALAVACGRERWPDPPPVDEAQYRKDYEAWREERRETAAFALKIAGIWPLAEGDTPFGADGSLPVGLAAPGVPARAGVFRRAGDSVTVIPAPRAGLALVDGGPIERPMEIKLYETVLALGSLRLELLQMGEESPARLFIGASDEDHPAVREAVAIDAYAVDSRWRVAARFDAFDAPEPVRVPDVRGGFLDFEARGQLVFRLDGREMRLTALGEDGGEEFFVMFKDPTNGSTTYSGYRILSPRVVAGGGWTVLDFNLAANPPCAYSRFTTCPLPPPENRLEVAVEAGEKRHPLAPTG
jgi:hypothetical protein